MKIDEIIEQYLSGKLSETEMQNFEDEFFRNDALFEQLQLVVAEHLEAYVMESLTPEQKAMIERKFLCDVENRELLNTIGLLRQYGKRESKGNLRFSEAA
jgi:hypothetical protein